jgi:hypothetical protein
MASHHPQSSDEKVLEINEPHATHMQRGFLLERKSVLCKREGSTRIFPLKI